MLIRRTVLAGTTDSFPINGRYFSLIQGSNCRVNLLSNNARVFSSEVYEGMGTKLDVAITHVEIESNIEQVVEYWLGESEYRYTPPALRALNVKMSQVGVKTGISRIITANTKRLKCKLKFRDDCFIGGDDLALDGDGNVVNGVPIKAGEVIPIESSGSVNAFMTTRNENEFVNGDPLPCKRLTSLNVGNLIVQGVSYVDVDIPSHLVNKDISGSVSFSAPAVGDSTAPTAHGVVIAQSSRTGGTAEQIGWLSTSIQVPINKPASGSRTSVNKIKMKHEKLRLWVLTNNHEVATLTSLRLWHDDWEVIHSLIDVTEETL